MHNTINFWYGNWKKLCMKRSWHREHAKRGCPALHTDKNFIKNWFHVCKLGYSRKKMVVKHILFWKKQVEFLGLLFHPWKFWTKQSYSSLKNPAKLYNTYWEWSQILCDFFFIAPEDSSYFLFSPGNSTLYFFNIPGKSKSWNSQFCDFTWTDKLLIMKFLGE